MQPTDHARPGEDARVGDPLTGRLLDGRYRIGPRVARGGMASVYEATDLRLDRTVAVKVMHPGLGDDEEFAQRFVREARAAARLSHPNVVAVYDQGEEDGTVFLAMELVQGHTLRDVVRKESPMTPARALALVEPVLSALACAHRAGLVHRDVKPENVLIATDPGSGASRVKVADFGLAKAVSTDTQHTATGGVLIGTVSYLAPELVVDGRADARADVYAVGVLLYELLTGAKPHEGESPIQVAYKHVHEDVPAPSLRAPGIPAYVDALVARATARDRAHRPADAAVMLHQLHRVAQALDAGVLEDPELESDLRPRPAVAPTDDTAPDPFDDADLTALATVVAPREVVREDRLHAERTTLLPDEPGVTGRTPPGRPAGPVGRRPRRSRRGPALLVVALLLAAAAGVGSYWFGWARYTVAPGVLGLGERAAVQKLEAAGLEAELGEPAYSETVPAGKVLATDPAAGERVLDGGTVTLVLSLGKERYDVPRLRGLTEQQAVAELEDTNLVADDVTEVWSETVPEGAVVRTDPAAGTTLKPDALVDLVVSKGPRPVQVRSFVGRSADEAEAWFAERGIEVDRSETVYSDRVAEGDVVSQDPETGTLYRGDEVTLVVSRGPEMVEVPSGIVGSGVEAARDKLEGLGFEVDVQETRGYLGLGYVFSMSPDSGDLVPRGSTITIYLV